MTLVDQCVNRVLLSLASQDQERSHQRQRPGRDGAIVSAISRADEGQGQTLQLPLANKDEAKQGPSGHAGLWNTASLPRGGELLRQAIEHLEYGFNAVAGEERQRRCPE